MTEKKNEKGIILIVDDMPANISVFKDTLVTGGYQVSVATSGEKAIERINRIKPDLILLDILMPEMDGFETCMQIKSQETMRDIPVIFLTALNETFDKVKGFTLGAVDYLIKPVAPEELLARVKTHLSINRLEKEIQEANRSLEERIEHRTVELSAANLLLEQEVVERKKAQDEVLKKNMDLQAAYQELMATEEGLRENYDELMVKEEQLIESEANFRDVLENSLVALYKRDYATNRYDYMSPAISTIIGYKPDEIMHMTLENILDLVHPDDRKEVKDGIREAIACGGGIFHTEYRFYHKNGQIKWVGDLSHIFVDQEGRSLYCIGSMQDITDRKMAEEGLSRATNKLNMLNTITFNDIQNYIFSLSGYLELEKDISTDEEILMFLERQKDIIQNIINSLKFAENYQYLGLQPPKWQSVKENFLYGISHMDLSQLSRLLNVEGLEIYADSLFENVFFALAENVILHGKFASEIALWYREAEGGLTIVFEDNGQGITEDMEERLFERKTIVKKGMDLFLAREILGITGINIIETGEPGKGARFEMMVPKGAYRFTHN